MPDFRSQITRVTESRLLDNLSKSFSNEIYYSDVKVGYVHAYRSNFSIKYVIDGMENYRVGNSRVSLQQGQYLIVNDDQRVECLSSEAKALSFFLNREILNDIVANLQLEEEYLLDNPSSTGNKGLNFFENVYSANDGLGTFLKQFYRRLGGQEDLNLSEEFFFELGLNLVSSQLNVLNEINQLKNIKFSTRRELYRRALIAKLYIEGIKEEKFNLDQLCRACFLSKYHLIRTFKAIFNTTPYNYYLDVKVNRSLELLRHSDLSITKIAEISGFSDIHSYSKRFKKVMGKPPVAFKINR